MIEMESYENAESGYPDDRIVIESVGDFIHKIRGIDDESEKLGSNHVFVFRGQRTSDWTVEPSIFRDQYLSIEHDLLQQPLLQNPNEFNYSMDAFEIMTKYQHYGMCTRLLDLTTNPLVALYFACESHESDKLDGISAINSDEVEENSYGVVYYKSDYVVAATDQKVKIVSALAQMNLNQMSSIESVLDELNRRNVISVGEKKKWISHDGVKEFIGILQENYLVRPVYSNNRLIRQSGMFMLASCFTVKGNDINDFIIEKSKDNFQRIFDGRFYIAEENKNAILQELDRCNINEATLFPELDHQLRYIKSSVKGKKAASDFVKYEPSASKLQGLKIYDEVASTQEFKSATKKYLSNKYENKIVDELWRIIFECTQEIDWYKESNKSKIVMKITRFLKGQGNTMGDSKQAAQRTYEFVIHKAQELSV
jgi:FRG domain protein